MESLPELTAHPAPRRAARSEERKPLHPARKRTLVALALLGSALIVWHFAHSEKPAPAAGPAGGPPGAAPVTVQTVTRQKLRLWNDFSGRLRAVSSADLRPEVSGRLTEVRFQDGQTVRAGDILFVIDPRPFQAAVARAEARIASAQASLQLAAANQTRNTSLLQTRAIAQREFDQSESAAHASAAELLAAQADLQTAQVDLDHAFVKAPIAGRVSRAELTLGNLVQSGAGAPLLTSIVSEDGIYADFEVDEQTYLTTIHDGAIGNAQEAKIPVELTVAAEAGPHPWHGFIQNFDNQLDVRTGTIRARAKFDNADGALVPGMFVSVRLASSSEQDLVFIPDRAIGFDQSRKFVFVVSPENKVAYREVELGRELGGRRVVLKGLEAGDRVIVDGVQRVHADATVAPTELAEAEKAGSSRYAGAAEEPPPAP